VSRAFRRGRTLYVYLQVYQSRADTTRPLIGFVALYRAGSKVVETAPTLVTAGVDARSAAVPLRFSVPLDEIATGEYECQVTVLDPEGQRAAFWRAAIVVVP
jgi:hypothetical protein